MHSIQHSQILAAKEQFDLVKADREQAQTDVLAHGRVMAKLKQEEIEAAAKVTEDHIHACEQGKPLGDTFPNIQVKSGFQKKASIVRRWRHDLEPVNYLENFSPVRKQPGMSSNGSEI